jgi:hypothetical protein
MNNVRTTKEIWMLPENAAFVQQQPASGAEPVCAEDQLLISQYLV